MRANKCSESEDQDKKPEKNGKVKKN